METECVLLWLTATTAGRRVNGSNRESNFPRNKAIYLASWPQVNGCWNKACWCLLKSRSVWNEDGTQKIEFPITTQMMANYVTTCLVWSHLFSLKRKRSDRPLWLLNLFILSSPPCHLARRIYGPLYLLSSVCPFPLSVAFISFNFGTCYRCAIDWFDNHWMAICFTRQSQSVDIYKQIAERFYWDRGLLIRWALFLLKRRCHHSQLPLG